MVRQQLVSQLVVLGRVVTALPLAPTRLSVTGRVTLLTVLIASVGVGVTLDGANPSPSLLGMLCLALAVAITELRPVHVGRDGERQSFTLTEGPVVAALAMGTGRAVVVGVALGVLLAQTRRRMPIYKLAFNVAQFGAAAAIANRCAQLVGGQLGVVVAIMVFALANEALVRLVLRVATGRPSDGLHGPGASWFLHVSAATSIGLLAAHVIGNEPGLLPAFAAPVLLIVWSQEQSGRRRARTAVQRVLANQATALYGRSSEETGALLTRTAREVLAAGKVELVLLTGGRLLRTTDDHGHIDRGHMPAHQLTEGWAAEVLAAPGSTSHDYWAGVVIGSGDSPRALLSVWRDEDQEPFHAPDLALLDTLAESAAAWLDQQPTQADRSLDLRRTVAGLGAQGAEVAEALSNIRAVRQRLESVSSMATAAPVRAALADDLRDAEESIAEFIAALVTPTQRGESASVDSEMVVTGRWARGA
ncbi:MAG: hypothetical protein M3N21_08215 [Actinomycetota bacterium]|nr:hypothetical protein [Actinomycetota bacterium]